MLNRMPPGVMSLRMVTRQLVVVPLPKTASAPSVQAVAALPFHQVVAPVPQLSLPSCGPVPELPASQLRVAMAAGVKAQAEGLAAELPTWLVAVTV